MPGHGTVPAVCRRRLTGGIADILDVGENPHEPGRTSGTPGSIEASTRVLRDSLTHARTHGGGSTLLPQDQLGDCLGLGHVNKTKQATTHIPDYPPMTFHAPSNQHDCQAVGGTLRMAPSGVPPPTLHSMIWWFVDPVAAQEKGCACRTLMGDQVSTLIMLARK